MSEPTKSPGLFASARQLLGTALECVQDRLALISNEVEQEKLRLFDGLLWAGLGLVMLSLGALLLAAFLVVLFWESHRLEALGVLTVLFLGFGTVLLNVAYARLRKPGGLFSSSIEEIARDRAALGGRE